jgi:hypothetical protein
VFGASPGFINETSGDYHLTTNSVCRNAGTALNAAVLPTNDVTDEYVVERTFQSRWNDGRTDIGAFEVPGDPYVLVTLPTIETQPQSQTASIGEDVVFNISATGAFLQYQWKRAGVVLVDGTSVTGSQTDTLTLRNVGPTSGGSYSVTVRNNAGSTNTAPASLVVTNPYVSLGGTYNGLFYESDEVRSTHAGFLSVVLKTNGVFSGSYNLKGVNRAFSGRFVNGASHVVVATNPFVAMDMTIDLSGTSGTITGAVTGTNWSAPLLGERVGFTNAIAVREAVSLMSANNGSTAPGGDGFGVATISTNGKFTLTGTLSDGFAFSAIGGSLTQNGDWPVYASLYGNTGVMVGWLSRTSGIYGGTLAWVKPGAAGSNYTSGFTNFVTTLSSLLPTMTKSVRALAITNGIVVLSNDSLPAPITNHVVMTQTNTFVVSPGQTNGLKLSLNLNTGQITGSFTNPISRKINAIKGIVMPQQNVARGFFLSPQTGRFSLEGE